MVKDILFKNNNFKEQINNFVEFTGTSHEIA
jgi:hypothetical protein